MLTSHGADGIKLHMLNPATWPEVMRLYFTQEDKFSLIESTRRTHCIDALEHLRTTEYSELPMQDKLALLRLLCDEVSSTKMMSNLMNEVAHQRNKIMTKRHKELSHTDNQVRDPRAVGVLL